MTATRRRHRAEPGNILDDRPPPETVAPRAQGRLASPSRTLHPKAGEANQPRPPEPAGPVRHGGHPQFIPIAGLQHLLLALGPAASGAAELVAALDEIRQRSDQRGPDDCFATRATARGCACLQPPSKRPARKREPSRAGARRAHLGTRRSPNSVPPESRSITEAATIATPAGVPTAAACGQIQQPSQR